MQGYDRMTLKTLLTKGNSQNAVYLWHFIMDTHIYYQLYTVLNSFTHTHGLTILVFLLTGNNNTIA